MKAISEFDLLPAVKNLVQGDGSFIFKDGAVVAVVSDSIADVWPVALRLRGTLLHTLGVRVEVVAGNGVSFPDVLLDVGREVPGVPDDQGYALRIEQDRITVRAASGRGLHHGLSTLVQIVADSGRTVPCLDILDWPEFEVRGVLLDVSRDRVPNMETLFRLIDELASFKVNQLHLYTEHTFGYLRHPEVWANASPITAEEMIALDRYCRDRYVELVPCQATLGHMHRWLRHREYAHLAEVERTDPPLLWGSFPFSLAAVDPESVELVRSLYDELLPCFTSPLVNACLDEAQHGGLGRSRAAIEERGAGTVYLEYVTKIAEDLASRNRRMLMWADVLATHPHVIPDLPDGVTALVWGYIGSDEPFATQGALFAEAGVPFYVCPGTWSGGTVVGASDRTLANQNGAARHGSKFGAVGYLVNDWGRLQNGTIQPLPISRFWLGVGAGFGWAGPDASTSNVPQTVGRRVFGDRTGAAGSILYEIGNLYQRFPIGPYNASFLFEALREPLESLRGLGEVPEETLNRTIADLADLEGRLALAAFEGQDAVLVKQEMQLAIHLAVHACHRGLLAHRYESAPSSDLMSAELEQLIREFVDVWSARFRPGGLAGTVARFGRLGEEYRGSE
ncbi:MAG: hypothetical protein BMS9Abin12_1712 [Acidimicrobiia bacterium]|nr:MAG: hypothetical protein BMS9Abin12_1712 [Acidimicrobiia bacterium]